MRISIILLFSLLLFLPGYQSRTCQCADRWVTYQGHCYLFGTTGKTWIQAKYWCRKHKGHLVHIDSKEESAFVKDYISRLMGDRFWIGLNDRATEGQWKWVDTNTSATYQDWAPNEPNAYRLHDDCVAMAKTTYKGHWIDENCILNYLPICERSDVSISSGLHCLSIESNYECRLLKICAISLDQDQASMKRRERYGSKLFDMDV